MRTAVHGRAPGEAGAPVSGGISMRHFALYARVSSPGQAERHTVQQQLEILRQWCREQGIVDAVDYVDDGVSSTKLRFDKRPEGGRLIAEAQLGNVRGLAICDWDLLSRPMHDSTGTLYFLEHDLGIPVTSVTQPFEKSPEGNLQRNIVRSFSEYEGERIRMRTMRGSRTHARTES